MRQIDAVCRRFESDWRAGSTRSLDDYLTDVPEEARTALRDELTALEHELRQSEETLARTESGSTAEALTVTPAELPTPHTSGPARPSVHEDATVAPNDQATLDLGPASKAQSLDAAPPRIRYFGDYEIVREIARGGMGVVFQARQVSLNRPVALKMILAGQLANETDVKRFYTEAESAANLDHPGIVPIYEVGQHEGQHYFSMGFVEGQSLSHRLAEGPLPPRQAAELMVKVADAIEFAHQRGVIHRDLKPANILLDKNGNPRVTDFGLAKRLETDSGLTGSGQIMGTPSYMPPEQAGGKRGAIGPEADVYALGATLYALLTGRPPFQAATAMDTVIQVVSDEPVPPRRLNALVPLDLETICLKCLGKEPGKRYASAAALAEDLRRFLAGEPIVARPVTRLERVSKWVRRRPVIAALSASVAVTALLGLSGIVWQWREAVAARIDAQEQAGIAREQAGIARDNELAARNEAEFANRRLYDVQMNVVQRAWEDWSPSVFLGTLDEQRPEYHKGVDRRGFEWFYWQRKASLGHVIDKGHTNLFMSVAFSPDGTRLVSASSVGAVKVWDVVTGHEALTLNGPWRGAMSAAFSPDGKRLACANFDQTVTVCDAITGHETLTLNGHNAPVYGVAFSPDGSRIASVSSDHTVKVWDAATGHETLTLRGHNGDFTGVAFSPDGSRLASASGDWTVKVWDAATGQEIRTLKGHTSAVLSVAFSPDGQRLASAGGDGTVKVWDTATGHDMLTLKGHDGPVYCVAFNPDGSRLVSGSHDSTVKVWDQIEGHEPLTLKGHDNTVRGVAFSPDGTRIASAGGEGVIVWIAVTGQETFTFKGHLGEVWSVAFSPDGSRIASASWDDTVKVWDAATGQETLTLRGHNGDVTGVAFSPDGSRLASASGDWTVKVWDVATGHEMRTLKGHSFRVEGLTFSPDGSQLASASRDKTVRVWDAITGHETLTLKGHTDEVWSVAFSPDGSRLASASDDKTVKVWDAATGRETLTLKGHTLPVKSVAFSPDGSRLASASDDKTVKVWDAATALETLTLKGHANAVRSVAFSPDGTRIASTSDDRTIKVWDAGTGQETLTLKGHTSVVHGLAFSPDGRRIASASDDKTVKVWDAREPTPESLAQEEVRGLVVLLITRSNTEADLRDRIARDRTRSPEVRAAALDMVRSAWAMRIRRRAEGIVGPLFARMFVREDVLAALQAKPAADPEIQVACLKLAESWHESAMECNNAAFYLVCEPGRPEAISLRGLRLAGAACRLDPDNGTHLNTLGLAQYRAGLVAEALATLTRSNTLNKEKEPADLAFLAMAHQRLSQPAEARAMLERLRNVMRQAIPKISQSAENRGFLAEAEAVVLYDPIFPADPFAP
jgi:WD40 repeat protein